MGVWASVVLWVEDGVDAPAVLDSDAVSDEAAATSIVEALYPQHVHERLPDFGVDGVAQEVHSPLPGKVYVGCLPGVTLLAAYEICVDRADQLPPAWRPVDRHVVLIAGQGTSGGLLVAVWDRGRLIHEVRVDHDHGTVQSFGVPRSMGTRTWPLTVALSNLAWRVCEAALISCLGRRSSTERPAAVTRFVLTPRDEVGPGPFDFDDYPDPASPLGFAAQAVHSGRLDLAEGLLEGVGGPLHEAVRALVAHDLERCAAWLHPAPMMNDDTGLIDGEAIGCWTAIAKEAATRLLVGGGPQRSLASWLAKRASAYGWSVSTEEGEARQRRYHKWTGGRELASHDGMLAKAVIAICERRLGEPGFEAWAAAEGRHCESAFAVRCALACMESGSDSVDHFETLARQALRDGQEADVERFIDKMSRGRRHVRRWLLRRFEHVQRWARYGLA